MGEREGVRGEGREAGGMREGLGGGGGGRWTKEKQGTSVVSMATMNGGYRRKGTKDMPG